MTAVAFDMLRFVRTLRDKAHLTPKQAKGLADALVGVLDDNLATNTDVRALCSDVEALRLSLKLDFDGHRLSRKSEIGALHQSTAADIAGAKSNLRKWMFCANGFQTMVTLGAGITPDPSPR